RPHAGLALAQQAAVELGRALPKDRRVPVNARLHVDGLHDRDVGLAEEQVGEDQGVGRTFEDELPGPRAAVAALHLLELAGHERVWNAAEPLEVALIARGPVDLDMAAAPVAYDGLDRTLLAHHGLVLGPDRLEERAMHEAQVITVAVVLGQHLPVRGAPMLHPAGRQRDLALG